MKKWELLLSVNGEEYVSSLFVWAYLEPILDHDNHKLVHVDGVTLETDEYWLGIIEVTT